MHVSCTCPYVGTLAALGQVNSPLFHNKMRAHDPVSISLGLDASASSQALVNAEVWAMRLGSGCDQAEWSSCGAGLSPSVRGLNSLTCSPCLTHADSARTCCMRSCGIRPAVLFVLPASGRRPARHLDLMPWTWTQRKLEGSYSRDFSAADIASVVKPG